ncbi:MAG: hypothetical protein ACJ76J_19025 [Thermoanaerobaculia bacterium]
MLPIDEIDMEFGFPRGPDDEGARPENRAVAAFLGGTGRPDDPVFRAWLERAAFSGDDQVRGMPIRDQMRLQLAFLDEALRLPAGPGV